ncbi:MAG: segregation/condensation protein A, partial [Myxococcales bacterium]|nr:segregation/condensation protein A [Myxococcales bacterium]
MASETARGADAGASNLADERGAAVYAVELPIFEGPLDLLLHVVRRHELDILDIPIAFITEKYLEYLDMMRALDIEIAGDYLVMAATLAYLKSRELVPQREEAEGEAEGEGEEGEDPREALIRRLVEYERYRAASRELDSMPVRGRDVFLRGREIDLPPLDPGMAPVTLFRLAEAYSKVLQRAKISKSHEVVLEPITVRQRMEQLSLLLEERGVVEFESLFLGRSWGSELELRQMLVVTLMSVLELVKLGIIGVDQVTETEAIRLRRRASHAAAIQAMTGYDEASSFGTAATPGAGAGPSAPPQPLVGVAGAASEGRDEAADEVVDEVAVDAASDEVERAGDAGAGDDEEEDEEDVVEAEVTAWLTRDEPERRARAAAGEG